ncbi:MAG: RNA methyltransferase [Lachnospiraceae bacterium]|nr:RNA methyltransferase [Lachnospiraceae bacterium]
MITSVKNEKLRNVTLLQKKKKAREEQGLFVTEGLRIFEDALKSAPERIEQIFVSETFSKNPEWKRICNSFPQYEDGIKVTIVSDDAFDKISETVTPQGIICIMRMKFYSIADIPPKRLLLLENIQDPGNLGTMVRTAEAAGITGMIMSSDTVDIYSPKVTRSTMGSIFRVPFLYTDDICETIDELKKKGVTVYGAYLRDGKPYNSVDYKEPCAVLIGNEGNGITDRTISKVSERVFIPMSGQIESLNAAVAAALIMYKAQETADCFM